MVIQQTMSCLKGLGARVPSTWPAARARCQCSFLEMFGESGPSTASTDIAPTHLWEGTRKVVSSASMSWFRGVVQLAGGHQHGLCAPG